MIRIDPETILTPGVRSVLRALRAGGAVARLVGGCVRDAILEESLGDRDVAVDVPPHEAVRLLEAKGIAVKPIGIGFGSVLALPPTGGGYHVTSLRADIETDGRWPVVRFGSDWVEDARRRDFTMNALYADEEGAVFDPIGGIGDLRARRVRFIGSPADRVREDYLRILRFFRFHAWYGTGPMNSAGLRACAAEADRIAGLSGERIGNEMRRLLAAPDPAGAVVEAKKAGVLDQVLPGSEPGALGTLVALERRLGIAPDWKRRWLLLSAGVAAGPRGRWPLSRSEERDLRARLAAWKSRPVPIEAGYRWGAAAGSDAMLVRAARGEGDVSAADLADARRAAGADLPIQAADLIGAGLKMGPEVGRALRRAERYWLLRGMQAGCEELIEAALGARD